MNATPIVIVSLALTAVAGIPVLPSPVQDKPSRAALEREWAAIEKAADSRRYTGRSDTRQ